MDGTGTFINREEYTPYGETSFGSFARKRYRFTGKERDEESGLNYHSARYYAPWLARWVSPDPLGPVDGVNLYPYARNNPIRYTDRSGGGSDDAKTTIKPKPTPPKPPPSKPFIDISNADLPTKQGIELPKPQKPSAYPWPKDIPRDPKLPDSSKPLGDVPKPQPPTNPPRAYPDTPVRPAELDPPLFVNRKTPLKKPTGPLGTVPKPQRGGNQWRKRRKGWRKEGPRCCQLSEPLSVWGWPSRMPMLATIGGPRGEGFGAIPLIGDAKDLVETGVAGVELGVAGVVAGYDSFFGPVVGPAPVRKSMAQEAPPTRTRRSRCHSSALPRVTRPRPSPNSRRWIGRVSQCSHSSFIH